MKKIMIADILKAVEYDKEQEIIAISERFKISIEEADYLYSNFDKNRWEDVINTADELNVDITDLVWEILNMNMTQSQMPMKLILILIEVDLPTIN